jgi:hypothetical protein
VAQDVGQVAADSGWLQTGAPLLKGLIDIAPAHSFMVIMRTAALVPAGHEQEDES